MKQRRLKAITLQGAKEKSQILLQHLKNVQFDRNKILLYFRAPKYYFSSLFFLPVATILCKTFCISFIHTDECWTPLHVKGGISTCSHSTGWQP